MKYIDAAPNKIYLNRRHPEPYWFEDKQIDSDIEYIRKEYLQQEQPEADLDADIEMEWDSFNKHLVEYGNESKEVIWLDWLAFADIANYFYNIGRNAGKEEKK